MIGQVVVSGSPNGTAIMFQGLNRPTPMLDNEPSKFKSWLIKRGSLASRHLPQPQGTGKNSQGDDDDDDEDDVDEDDDVEENDDEVATSDNEDDFDFG